MVECLARRIAAGAKRLLRAPALRRLARREDGAVAIEFGLVAMPFFGVLLATIETALVFFAGQVLETAVADSSRLIMTRQAQSQNFDAAAFKNQVCAKASSLFDCAGIYVDVRTAASFASANLSKPLDNLGNLLNNFTYQPGVAGDVVVVRIMYQWPIYLNFSGFNLTDMTGGKKLLMATATFRNEP